LINGDVLFMFLFLFGFRLEVIPAFA